MLRLGIIGAGGIASLHTHNILTGPETDVPLTYYEDRMRENMQTLLVALNPAEGE